MIGYTIHATTSNGYQGYLIGFYANHSFIYSHSKINYDNDVSLSDFYSLIVSQLSDNSFFPEARIYELEKDTSLTKVLLFEQTSALFYVSGKYSIVNYGVNVDLSSGYLTSFYYKNYIYKTSSGSSVTPSTSCSFTLTHAEYSTYYALKITDASGQIYFNQSVTKPIFNGLFDTSRFVASFNDRCKYGENKYSNCNIVGYSSQHANSSNYSVYVFIEDGYLLEVTSFTGSLSQVTTYLNERINHHKEICKNKNKIPTDCCILVCCEPDKYYLIT